MTSKTPARAASRQPSDHYRQKWRWDRVVRGTHLINCWYQRNCAFNVFVKDGVAVREEQTGDYPQTNPSVPDFNPRGCQKGVCYADLTYNPGRVLSPLKRAGERGEGKWTRVTWDEAIADIANKIIDAARESGPETIVFDQNPTGVASYLAVSRFAGLLGATVLDVNLEVGDEQQGAAVTFGTPIACRSADDYFHSDLIFIWGGNPVYTQIPNYHFLAEARYNGARVVTISPDFSPSAVHADTWVTVKPGTDAALALGMAQVIIAGRLYNEGFVREQTDLPLLVRTDTRRFLRESDLRPRGADDVFYVFDTKTQRIAKAPKRSLRLGALVPALEGEFEVATKDGPVKVKPVFQALKERLDAEYTPEQAAALCGAHPSAIRELAEALARAKAASCVSGASLSKFYHGDLMMRAQILLFALCGQMGRPGAGYDTLPFLIIDSTMNLPGAASLSRWASLKSILPMLPAFLALRMKGFSPELAMYELGRRLTIRGGVNSVMVWYEHGGLKSVSGRSREWDPYLKRDVDDYLEEAWTKGWQPRPPAKAPKALFAAPGNSLRRVRGGHRLIEHLVPQLDLIVCIDTRLSSTALYADYVLPAAGSYEKCDVTDWYTPLSPFAHVTNPAIAPVGEAMAEWDIFARLVKAIERQAEARGLLTYKGADGKRRRFDNLARRFTYGGRLGEGDHEKVAQTVMEMSGNFGRLDWQEFRKKGHARFAGLGSHPANFGNATDIAPDETIVPHRWRVEKKTPWPTMTRRIQFYIDQPLYMELGEELPVHKDPPIAGGDYPLTMTGGHNRHSIHASFRLSRPMLELERGEPMLCMSVADAEARGIANGDLVLVRNDVGEFKVSAKVMPAVRPGQVILYHAWENYQFPDGMGHRNVIATPINPVEAAGGYFHIQATTAILQPGHNDRDTRVEVTKAQ